MCRSRRSAARAGHCRRWTRESDWPDWHPRPPHEWRHCRGRLRRSIAQRSGLRAASRHPLLATAPVPLSVFRQPKALPCPVGRTLSREFQSTISFSRRLVIEQVKDNPEPASAVRQTDFPVSKLLKILLGQPIIIFQQPVGFVLRRAARAQNWVPTYDASGRSSLARPHR